MINCKDIFKALGILLLLVFFLSIESQADVTSSGSTTNTQSNNAGSNTAITGGYESSTTYQSGSSSNTTTSNTTNNSTNQKTAAAGASAPSMSAYSQQTCVVPITGGISTVTLGLIGGTYVEDEKCNRRLNADKLNKFGMKVAAISLMCKDPEVFSAMMDAGTPCPFDGMIGKDASKAWNDNAELRPDYYAYKKKIELQERKERDRLYWERMNKSKKENLDEKDKDK